MGLPDWNQWVPTARIPEIRLTTWEETRERMMRVPGGSVPDEEGYLISDYFGSDTESDELPTFPLSARALARFHIERLSRPRYFMSGNLN